MSTACGLVISETKACSLGKQLQPSSGRLRRPVCGWAWVRVYLWQRGVESGFCSPLNSGLASTASKACVRLAACRQKEGNAYVQTCELDCSRKRERARGGIEPTSAAPSQPDCPGVSRSDHSASSKESASWRALGLRSDWHGRLGVGRREEEGKETSVKGSQDEPAQDNVYIFFSFFNVYIYLFALFVQLPFSFLSCAGSSWLPFTFVSFNSFALFPTPNRPCQSERSPKARHEADSFEPAEWSERLTPGQSGWLGAAAVGSIPALTLSLFLQRLYFLLFLQCWTVLKDARKNFVSIRLLLEVRSCDQWDCELRLTWLRLRAVRSMPKRLFECTQQCHEAEVGNCEAFTEVSIKQKAFNFAVTQRIPSALAIKAPL